MGSAVKTPILQEFTIASAIPAGTLYIRFLVSSQTASNGTGNLASGTAGTSRICRPYFATEAEKIPIMKVTKL
jgi:hypothetical protein